MNIYVVFSDERKTELERFTEEKWNVVKDTVNSERVKLVTADLDDEALKEWDISEIVWDRIYNPQFRNYRKIKVPLSRNIIEMENLASEKMVEAKAQIEADLEKMKKAREAKINSKESQDKNRAWREQTAKNSELIPDDMDEYSAITEWKKLDYVMPAPRRITEIKESYSMSWNRFIEFTKTL